MIDGQRGTDPRADDRADVRRRYGEVLAAAAARVAELEAAAGA